MLAGAKRRGWASSVAMDSPYELPSRIGSGPRQDLAELATKQSAVARREQLRTLGVAPYVVDAMIAAARWRARGLQVVIMHNGPLTRRQELWAAVLNCPDPVALAARTAATEHGLIGWDAEYVEILVPRGARVPTGLAIDVKVHESRRFAAGDIHPGRQPPQVRIERAVIDAATWSSNPRTACGIVAAAVQQRLTTPARIRPELEKAGRIRYSRLLASALDDIEGGAQAVSELDFLRFCRRNGLPRPALQMVRRERSGRRRYLDATFKRADGGLVRVEIDGALHLVVQTYWDDMSRGNELAIGRETVLRFPSYVIYADDPVALAQLRRALDLSGSQRPIAS